MPLNIDFLSQAYMFGEVRASGVHVVPEKQQKTSEMLEFIY